MTQVLVDQSRRDTAPPPTAPNVPAHLRPSAARAAAAARVTGGPAAAAVAGAAVGAPSPENPEKRRHLRVVEKPSRSPAQRRRLARAILLGSVGVAVSVAFALVYLHVVLAQRQFRLDDLTAQVQKQQVAYQKLRLQVAQLDSPQHVIATAEGQLGMVQPAGVTYLTPSPGVLSTSGAIGGSEPSLTQSDPSSASTPAPAGDADWPRIKSQLAGSP
jgi:cell division protein FtsL